MSGSVGGHNIQLGATSGDVVILLDRPAYRLEFLTAAQAPPAVSRSRRRRPSYLLDPQREVVPYRPRPAEETALGAWLDEPSADVSVLWLSGPGGQGKTRLAGRIATERHAAGWAVAQAIEHGPRLRSGGVREPLADDQPLLVVIDYAERWRLELLVQLVENLPWDFPARRVRVLMLARPGTGVWDTVAAELDRARVELAEPVVLGEFTAARVAAFTDAAAAFSRQVTPGRPLPPPPADLDDPGYGSVLDLHMAALAAVCAADAGDTTPALQDLSGYLLHHERRAWTAAAGTDPVAAMMIETTAWVATLFGPTTGHTAAVALLRRAEVADGDADAAGLLARHERLYPSVRAELIASVPANVEVTTLQPVRPDRFGEDFVASYLRNHPHGVELLTRLVCDDPETASAKTLGPRRCLIVLAAAAARHEAVRGALWSLLGSNPNLVRQGGAPVLRAVVEHAPDDLADSLDRALPAYHTELLRPAADLARRLTDALPSDAPPEERAYRFHVLGNRLSNLGRREEALTATIDAVKIYRRLATTHPAAFEPDLARSLINLGIRLAHLGRHEDALTATTNAVDICRRLATTHPAAFEPDLARSLNNLGLMLSNLGRHEDALTATTNAVDIRRRLATTHPAAFEPDLARSLINLGIRLAHLGRHEDALTANTDAVQICRRLATTHPAAFEPDLARSLINLGVRLAHLGRHEDALTATTNAVDIRRRLATTHPAAFEPDLAMSLNNLGLMLSNLGRHEDALTATTNAVKTCRRLATTNPAAFEPNLATALDSLGLMLSNLGRHEDALTATTNAVEIRRRLATSNPAAFEPDLARSLWRFAWVRAAGNAELDATLLAAEESVAIYVRLHHQRPLAHADDLREALSTMADVLDGLGRPDEAQEARRRIEAIGG